MNKDVIFYCNAGAEVGFGHLRRCLFVAENLKSTGTYSVAFGGELSDKAQDLVRTEQPDAPIFEDLKGVQGKVAVVDYMYDPKDPEAYDHSLITSVAARAKKTVLLTSSRTAPEDLPVDVVVGHLVQTGANTQYKAKTGLRYAPVSPDIEKHRPNGPHSSDTIDRVFIGFGNSEDPSGVRLALEGLQYIDYNGRVDLLLPPSLVQHANALQNRYSSLSIELHHNVPSVPSLLTEADCLIGSYGHMTFEALALGVPPVVVGTKTFMVNYAQDLSKEGVLICAGHISDLSPRDIGRVVKELESDGLQKMSHRALSKVDGKGLLRVASEIEAFIGSAKS